MNWLDIIIAILLVWAAWRGFSTGVIRQIISLVALILGIWLALAMGTQVGLMLNVDVLIAPLVGFIVVFILVVFALVVFGFLAKGLFRLIGLGPFDSILGVLLSLIKTWAIMSILCFWLCSWSQLKNNEAANSIATTSKLFPVLVQTSDYIFPFVDFTKEQLSLIETQIDDNINLTE